MKFVFLLLIYTFSAQAYLSYGDGSDGACNWTANPTTLTKAVYNCTSLNIATGAVIQFSGVSSVIQWRVQGDVTIDGTITLSASGTTPGPGGANGATCNAGAGCNNSNASGTGAGNGGGAGSITGGADEYADGAGGSGGSFVAIGSSGQIGIHDASNNPGGLSGATGQTVGNPVASPAAPYTAASLNTSLPGGSGGGAGGSGAIFELLVGTTSFATGGNGGAGSGSIVIVAKGAVTLDTNTQINAIGGQGVSGGNVTGTDAGANNFLAFGGSGGGGSGGAVYIVSDTSVTANTPNVDISGGAVSGAAPNATGGAGSNGILRVDTPDSTIAGSFTVTGGAASLNVTPAGILDPSTSSSETTGDIFESDLEASCTYKEEMPFQWLSFIFAFGFMLFLFSFRGFISEINS